MVCQYFYLKEGKSDDQFAVVRVNHTLVLILRRQGSIAHNHYAFRVTVENFDNIFARIGDGDSTTQVPQSAKEMAFDSKIYQKNGGKGVYFLDPSGHILEI